MELPGREHVVGPQITVGDELDVWVPRKDGVGHEVVVLQKGGTFLGGVKVSNEVRESKQASERANKQARTHAS